MVQYGSGLDECTACLSVSPEWLDNATLSSDLGVTGVANQAVKAPPPKRA
jgi:hypothetical protein